MMYGALYRIQDYCYNVSMQIPMQILGVNPSMAKTKCAIELMHNPIKNHDDHYHTFSTILFNVNALLTIFCVLY